MPVISFCKIDAIRNSEIDQYLTMLPNFMAEEIYRYRLESDRKAKLLSRLMLLKYLREDKKEYLINDWRRDSNYKPFIAGWKFFNIAHSGEIAACTCSTSEVGLDVEKKILISFSEITSQFCLEEKDYIFGSDNIVDRFYEIWVKKEAVLKAAGLGIVNGLQEICCLQEQVIFKNKIWYFRKLNLGEGYTAFLCTPEYDVLPTVINFKPEELIA